MGIKLKKLDKLLIIKILVFIIAVICFASSITLVIDLKKSFHGEKIYISTLHENNYYESKMLGDDITNSIGLMDKYLPDKGSAMVGNAGKLGYMIEKLHKGLKYHYLNLDMNYIPDTGVSTRDGFKTFPAYILCDEELGTIEVFPKELENNSYYTDIIKYNAKQSPGRKQLYLAFTDEFLNPRIEIWKEQKNILTMNAYIILSALVILLIAFVFLVIFSGRKSSKNKDIHMCAFNKIYNDINLLLCIGIVRIWYEFTWYIYHSEYYCWELLFAETFVFGIIGLSLLLSIVKHIKNKTFIKHTLIYTIINKLRILVKEIKNQGVIGKKTTYIIVGYSIVLLSTFFIFPVTICIALWLVLKKTRDYNDIKKVVNKIENGNYNCRIEIASGGELRELAESINCINDGLKKAIDNKLKSERLKTDLISNVSHDIRTPLTSIITYVDLLKQEKDSDKSKKYIGIIDNKSQRLKKLTDDLFELSKASSGNIKVNYDKIDVVSLITQALGELHEKIEDMGYDFRVNYPKNNLYVKADGLLLWRVVENLLNNIIKYASKGSRVYIDMYNKENIINIVFKNISANELNIPIDELLERFTRGDNSRSSEGSGLGLAIAKSLTELQRGEFLIDIDGDLFKATIQIPEFIDESKPNVKL
ncbi:hypothetical protein SH1V18_20920 [Vallitalea longa]|uniref:histidine kinase n=1 Tax=Vallitalea longa TaxID=2936439 RepID=A0A9W6DFM0_9FIRM|nr:HAMP domain-containing sensor histidine kinase [Vallitalea longa]GKX29612.1 hypothetical protein SH1V18_20920 [Vallitalea longa]